MAGAGTRSIQTDWPGLGRSRYQACHLVRALPAAWSHGAAIEYQYGDEMTAGRIADPFVASPTAQRRA